MAEKLWRFTLARSDDLTNINEIAAPDISLELALNKPGSCRFTVPVDSKVAEDIESVVTCIKAYRKGILIWSGFVWPLTDSLPENQLEVNAVGWFDNLNHRLLRYEKVYADDLQTAGEIALELLDITNNQTAGPLSIANPDGDPSYAVRPTFITPGTSTDGQDRNRRYERWQNIGQAITELSTIENGYDFEVTPDTRVLNVYSSNLGGGLRRDRPQAQFGYNWGPNNLRSFKRTIDPSSLATEFHAINKFSAIATGLAGPDGDSTAPINVYGLWEDQLNIGDVTDDTLSAFANEEVSLRSTPRIIYNINPFPYSSTSQGRVPEPFVDYRIGDQVYFTAKFGKRIQIKGATGIGQAARVYGMKLTFDSEGNEKIDDLQISPD